MFVFAEIAEGMVSSGLSKVGFQHIWLDDGWVVGRDNKTGMLLEDRVLFPSGMGNITSHIHQLGLKFGERDLTNNRIYSIRHGGNAPTFSYIPSAIHSHLISSPSFSTRWVGLPRATSIDFVGIYTASAALTCLGNQPTQPDRPGSCGHEEADADLFANKWQVDAVKDDACGICPEHDPFVAMRDALNNTGRHIWYSIHVSKPNSSKHSRDHAYAGPDINGSLVSHCNHPLIVSSQNKRCH